MTNTETNAAALPEFLEALTPEFSRAWDGVVNRGVASYSLYITPGGDIEAMAEPIRYDGALFATLDREAVGDWPSAAEYLEFYGGDLYSAYRAALAE